MGNRRPDDNRHGNSKVVDHSSGDVTAEEGAELESTEEEDGPGGSKTQNSTQEGNREEFIVLILRMDFVGLVAGIKIAQDTRRTERITHSIHDEDDDNEHGKDLISETSSKLDITGDVHEGCKESESTEPDRDPSIPGDVLDSHAFRNVLDGSADGQSRSSRSNDAHGHTTNEGIGNSNPSSSKDGFNGPNVIVTHGSISSTKGQGRGNDTDENQATDSHSLLVKVGHLLQPPGSNSALELGEHTNAPWPPITHAYFSFALDEAFVALLHDIHHLVLY